MGARAVDYPYWVYRVYWIAGESAAADGALQRGRGHVAPCALTVDLEPGLEHVAEMGRCVALESPSAKVAGAGARARGAKVARDVSSPWARFPTSIP